MQTEQASGGRLAELSASECWQLLESEEIARVAWNGPHGVALVPVNYTVVDGALWFRTNAYSALGRECRGQRIAVEVDHIDRESHGGWSVVVIGETEVVDAEDLPDMLVDFRVWPAGHRALFVRVDAVEVTGRRLVPRAPAASEGTS
jgi:hypothetical protein